MRVSVAREGRSSRLPIRERSQGLLVHVGFRAATIRAKVKSGLSVRHDIRFVIFVINLDI